jgi:hypothetical protein
MKQMKKSTILMTLGLGFGLLPMGCMSAVGDESTGTTEEGLASACYTNYGINPLKAALAVAMADELGRWDPVHDLVFMPSPLNIVQLSTTAVCIKNSCKNTKAILGQQQSALNLVAPIAIPQTLFSATSFYRDLTSSFSVQTNRITDLTNNHKDQLPVAHKLTQVAGPTNLGTGACGPHYVFQVDHTNGTALTSAEAANMVNALCFYGNTVCGNNNPFMSFTVTGQGCPTGRTCVAIDPTDGDNGSLTTTTTGAAQTYPYNRLYDPSNTKLNSACTTTTNLAGKMLSKCSTISTTCGYLYCIAN